MMRGSRLVAIAFAVALVLAGCAAIPEIPYDRSAASDVKTIGVVTPSIPDDARVVLASTPGQSFGLIGALIDAGIQADHESRLKAALAKENFSAKETFLQSLTAGLEAHGYTVTLVSAKRDQESEFLSRYPIGSAPKVDAYLDLVSSGYGYVAAGVSDSTPYRPSMAIRARLVRAKDSSVLMQDTIVYNPIIPSAAGTKGVVTLSPDPSYQFGSFGSLEENPQIAAKGLRVAIERSAETISQLLK